MCRSSACFERATSDSAAPARCGTRYGATDERAGALTVSRKAIARASRRAARARAPLRARRPRRRPPTPSGARRPPSGRCPPDTRVGEAAGGGSPDGRHARQRVSRATAAPLRLRARASTACALVKITQSMRSRAPRASVEFAGILRRLEGHRRAVQRLEATGAKGRRQRPARRLVPRIGDQRPGSSSTRLLQRRAREGRQPNRRRGSPARRRRAASSPDPRHRSRGVGRATCVRMSRRTDRAPVRARNQPDQMEGPGRIQRACAPTGTWQPPSRDPSSARSAVVASRVVSSASGRSSVGKSVVICRASARRARLVLAPEQFRPTSKTSADVRLQSQAPQSRECQQDGIDITPLPPSPAAWARCPARSTIAASGRDPGELRLPPQ